MIEKNVQKFAIFNDGIFSIFSRFDYIDGVEEAPQTAYIYLKDCEVSCLKDNSIPVFKTIKRQDEDNSAQLKQKAKTVSMRQGFKNKII